MATGMIVGKVISTEAPFVKLDLNENFKLAKQDTILYRHNMLGSAYIDVLKCSNDTIQKKYYTSNDTVVINFSRSVFAIDSNQKKQIINSLKKTLDNMDSILQKKE